MINPTGMYVSGAPAWWSPQTLPEKVKKVVYHCTQIMGPNEHKKNPKNGLLLHGPMGTGKTSAGIAILYAWGLAGHSAHFEDFGDLMIRIRSSWRRDAAKTTEQIFNALRAPKILMLDDIGKRVTPEDQEALSVLFNSRINLGHPTICTTNHDLTTKAGQEAFDAACDSRVAERFRGCDLQVLGENLRRNP